MKITEEYLLETIKKLELQKNNLLGDLNAIQGAIQLCNSILLDIKKEEKIENKSTKKEV